MDRYKNMIPLLHRLIYNLKSLLILADNNSSLTTIFSTYDLNILKTFNVTIHPPRPHLIKEVL